MEDEAESLRALELRPAAYVDSEDGANSHYRRQGHDQTGEANMNMPAIGRGEVGARGVFRLRSAGASLRSR